MDSVLIIGFGGPTDRKMIRPFLDNVLRGRPVPKERYEQVVRQYELIGGSSPYNENTFRQAEALKAKLNSSALPVYVGFRHWDPYIKDMLQRMADEGRRSAAGFILAAHRSEVSGGRYQSEVEQARKEIGPNAPEVAYTESWYDHPLFLDAAAARVREVLPKKVLPAGEKAGTVRSAMIFTAHSIPQSLADRSPYVEDVRASAEGVAARIGITDWSVAYQSRSGNPRDPWLEPDINDRIRQKAEEGYQQVVIVPIGFLCDHVEVLFDLDHQAQNTARAVGLKFLRAPTVGDHPKFIEMMAELVRRTIARQTARQTEGATRS